MSTLDIVQLYPEQLGVSGDGGNVVTLAERAKRAGLDVTVTSQRPGDALPATTPDVVLLGSGPLSTLRAIHADALRYAAALSDWADAGVPVIAIGGGMELLSNAIVPETGEQLDGLGFFDARAVRGAKRRTNYFDVSTSYEGPALQVLGFEDHATRFELGAGAVAFATVTAGGGNGDGRTTSGGTGGATTGGHEGIARGASFGTQLKGPVLPLNPGLADRVLTAALRRRGVEYATGAAHTRLDEFARKSREVITANLVRSFKAM